MWGLWFDLFCFVLLVHPSIHSLSLTHTHTHIHTRINTPHLCHSMRLRFFYYCFISFLYFTLLLSFSSLLKLNQFSYHTFTLRFWFRFRFPACMHFLPLSRRFFNYTTPLLSLGFHSNQFPWLSEASISNGYFSLVYSCSLISILFSLVSQFWSNAMQLSPFRYDGFFLSMLATSVYPFFLIFLSFLIFNCYISLFIKCVRMCCILWHLKLTELLLQSIGNGTILVHTPCTYGLSWVPLSFLLIITL